MFLFGLHSHYNLTIIISQYTGVATVSLTELCAAAFDSAAGAAPTSGRTSPAGSPGSLRWRNIHLYTVLFLYFLIYYIEPSIIILEIIINY